MSATFSPTSSETRTPSGVDGHEHRPRLDPADGREELADLVPAEDHREALRHFGADDLVLGPIRAEGDAVEEVQAQRAWLYGAPGRLSANQVKQVIADLLPAEAVGGLAEVLGERGHDADIGVLRVGG